MRFLNILLILTAFALQAKAEDIFLPTNAPVRVEKIERIELKEENSLSLLDPYKTYPKYENYWSEYAKESKVYYQIEYKGFQRLVLNRTRSLMNRYYRNWTKDYLNNSANEYDLRQKIKNLEYIDDNGQWNRNFWEYSSKDGSVEQIQTIGEDRSLFNLGRLNLYSSGKLRVDNLDLSLSDQTQKNNLRIYNNNQNLSNLDKIFFEISTPETSFIEDHNIKIKARIGLNVRTETQENASSFKANVSVVVGKKPWMRILIKTESQPFINQHSFYVSLELLRF